MTRTARSGPMHLGDGPGRRARGVEAVERRRIEEACHDVGHQPRDGVVEAVDRQRSGEGNRAGRDTPRRRPRPRRRSCRRAPAGAARRSPAGSRSSPRSPPACLRSGPPRRRAPGYAVACRVPRRRGRAQGRRRRRRPGRSRPGSPRLDALEDEGGTRIVAAGPRRYQDERSKPWAVKPMPVSSWGVRPLRRHRPPYSPVKLM